MNGIGLVLAGGGGKGAFQIGVWKALKEFGIDRRIAAVSGTSVGALNTLLFANNDLSLAEEIWKNLRKKDILLFQPATVMRLLPIFTGAGALTLGAGAAMVLTNALKNGVFSPEGIEELILKNIDMTRIRNCKMPLFAGSFAVKTRKMDYLRMDQKEPALVRQIAMASSALPVIFPKQEIDGQEYWDGGLADNVPVKPLYEIGIRTFIVCYLRDDIKALGFRESYPDAHFVEIIPSEPQGGMIKGTLDFSGESAVRRMKQGYEDAAAVLSPLYQLYIDNALRASTAFFKGRSESI